MAWKEVCLAQSVDHGAADAGACINLKGDALLRLIALQSVVETHQPKLH
jgi:hypothetical protein